MVFPREGNIFTFHQLTYYESRLAGNLDNVLPVVEANQPLPSYTEMGP